MLFTNSRTQHGSSNNNFLMNSRAVLPFSNRYLSSPIKGNPSTVRSVIVAAPEAEPVVKKMRWGEPTWFLFHTLAHKIKDEHFSKVRMELLRIIEMICNNLPCPNCTEHASQYIKNIPFYSIQSKQSLKNMLFQFHNDVNKRKNFKPFLIEDLDNKYEYANTVNIIQNFIYFFRDKSRSIRMIANDMHRDRLIKYLKDWFNANLQYFDN